MRTDSTNVAAPALAEVRDYIKSRYGVQNLPEQPTVHKTRAAIAQEAHECIRPTSVYREPESIRQHLDKDLFRLYQLIWQRFVASQMKPAIFKVTAVDVKAGDLPGDLLSNGMVSDTALKTLPYLFRATHSVAVFQGYLLVYQDGRPEDEADEGEGTLPPLTKGEVVDLIRLIPAQHFTEPPPRYTEATLVRELEKHGVGRPSTYAQILSTIQSRNYVARQNRYLAPTATGTIVNDLLVQHFPKIVDLPFTAQMEEDLDRIAAGERNWTGVLKAFYEPFALTLEAAEQNMQEVEIPVEQTGITCDKCGSPMVVKTGRFGQFIACSNYPACRNTKPVARKTGARCPECGGDLLQRKTRKGRTFFGCANYPKCKFSLWQRPLSRLCPLCGGLLVESGKTKIRCIKCETVSERQDDTEAGS